MLSSADGNCWCTTRATGHLVAIILCLVSTKRFELVLARHLRCGSSSWPAGRYGPRRPCCLSFLLVFPLLPALRVSSPCPQGLRYFSPLSRPRNRNIHTCSTASHPLVFTSLIKQCSPHQGSPMDLTSMQSLWVSLCPNGNRFMLGSSALVQRSRHCGLLRPGTCRATLALSPQTSPHKS